jgi:teichuronic acid biosynthesis glycosyltransferase TuaC
MVHAHYSFSAYVASLAGAKPLVVSLMGSDIKANFLHKFVIRSFSFLFDWKKIIVKSEDMRNSLKIKDVSVIPNGVDLSKFMPINKMESQLKLGWNTNKKYLLFAANPSRKEKNFQLIHDALQLITDKDIELKTLVAVSSDEINFWYNASDVILLSSLWEGSPNVIKEAMACCKPIVTTNVGDVQYIINETEGCFLAEFDLKDYANQVIKALKFSDLNEKTSGNARIVKLGLSSENIAKKLIDIYKA